MLEPLVIKFELRAYFTAVSTTSGKIHTQEERRKLVVMKGQAVEPFKMLVHEYSFRIPHNLVGGYIP